MCGRPLTQPLRLPGAWARPGPGPPGKFAERPIVGPNINRKCAAYSRTRATHCAACDRCGPSIAMSELATMAVVVGIVLGTVCLLTMVAGSIAIVLQIAVCKKEAATAGAEALNDYNRSVAYERDVLRESATTRSL